MVLATTSKGNVIYGINNTDGTGWIDGDGEDGSRGGWKSYFEIEGDNVGSVDKDTGGCLVERYNEWCTGSGDGDREGWLQDYGHNTVNTNS